MNTQGIRVGFHGKPQGNGGYSHATRNIARAFSESRVPVLFKSSAPFYKDMSTGSGPYNVDFYIHTPPFSNHAGKKYKIGYFYWETDRLPDRWARDIRLSLDEIWVPCNLTKKACRKAGFRGPIEVIHTPRPVEITTKPVAIPLKGSAKRAVGDDTFIFYSIFQWNERKGYRKLFRAYLQEFSKKDNVLLVVKTNPIKHKWHGQAKIGSDIASLKRYGKGMHGAPLFLITKDLSEEHLAGLHDLGDCFVLPHHGEGWGMPIHDAMMHNSLVITTPFGGITEHLDDSSALLIKHKMVPVRPMDWNPYYQSGQNWADADIGHLRRLMREALIADKAKLLKRTDKAKKIAKTMDIKAFSRKIESIFSQKRFRRLADL